MRVLDLFSGIGGFSLAASWVWGAEHEIVGFCEIDKYCQKVLKKHWPDVPIYEDIRSLDGRQFKDIDLITGGFPCQPFSVAGKQRGKKDDRHLWPEYLRLIQEIRPRWIIGENVAGIIRMELDTVLSDLEGQDYSCQAVVIPACAVDARHRRDRVWIVANARHDDGIDLQKSGDNGQAGRNVKEGKNEGGEFERSGCSCGGREDVADTGCKQSGSKGKSKRASSDFARCGQATSDTYGSRCEEQRCAVANGAQYETFECRNRWEPEPAICRVVNGLSNRVDRLKGLGNAIVPQVAAVIMHYLRAVDEGEAQEGGNDGKKV